LVVVVVLSCRTGRVYGCTTQALCVIAIATPGNPFGSGGVRKGEQWFQQLDFE